MVDALLILIALLLAAALAATAWSIVNSLLRRRAETAVVNGVPARRIAVCTAALLVVSLVLTFLLGSSQPLSINGSSFASPFWLKLTDMFIFTALILILVAVAGVAYGASGLNRRWHGIKREGGPQR